MAGGCRSVGQRCNENFLNMAVKSNTVWLMALTVALAVINLPSTLAKPCLCHIGVRYDSRKLIDFGNVKNLRALQSGKKEICSEACSTECRPYIYNPQAICDAIGSDFRVPRLDGIGCFSLVGTKGGDKDRWHYDERSNLAGCEKTCTVTGGKYTCSIRPLFGHGHGGPHGLPGGSRSPPGGGSGGSGGSSGTGGDAISDFDGGRSPAFQR